MCICLKERKINMFFNVANNVANNAVKSKKNKPPSQRFEKISFYSKLLIRSFIPRFFPFYFIRTRRKNVDKSCLQKI
jgi:hypothetical protein